MPLVSQGLSFVWWGSNNFWFGLACPANCQDLDKAISEGPNSPGKAALPPPLLRKYLTGGRLSRTLPSLRSLLSGKLVVLVLPLASS